MSAAESELDRKKRLQALRVELTGADPRWLQICREHYLRREAPALAGDNAAALRDAGAQWRNAAPDISLPVDPLAPTSTRHTDGAAAVALLTRALTDPTSTGTALSDAIAYAQRARLVSATAIDPDRWPETPGLDRVGRAVVSALEASGNPAAGFVALLALHIAGKFPSERTRSTTVPVLFDKGQDGGVGRLTLEMLPSGPAGLHPDPRSMTFSEFDDAVIESATQAWRQSGLAARGGCVVWSVREGDEPCDHVCGPSMGVAFGIVLDDLTPKPLRRVLRPHRIEKGWASTGGLAGGQIVKVGGAAKKLAAIERSADLDVRVVIVPKAAHAEFEAAKRHNASITVDLQPADTLREAIKLTRNRTNGTFVAVLVTALVGVIIATVAILVVRHQNATEVAAQARLRTAADLAAQVTNGTPSTARADALKALASWTANPTPEARAAMQAVSDRNTYILNNTPAHNSAVTSVVTTSTDVYSVDTTGTLVVSDLDTLKSETTLTAPSPLRTLAVAANRNDLSGSDTSSVLAAVSDRGVEIYSLTPHRRPLWRRTFESPELRPDVVTGLVLTIRDTVLAVQRDGTIISWDTSTGAPTTTTLTGTYVYGNPDESVEITAVDDNPQSPSATQTSLDPNQPFITLGLRSGYTYYTPATGKVHGSWDVYLPKNNSRVTSIAWSYSAVGIGTTAGIVYQNRDDGGSSISDLGGLNTRISWVRWTGSGDYLVAGIPGGVKIIGRDLNGVGQHSILPTTLTSATITATAPIAGAGMILGGADGTLSILDPANTSLGLPPAEGTNFPVFTPDGLLLTTNNQGPAGLNTGISATEVIAPTGTADNRLYFFDDLPGSGTVYINNLAASQDLVAASGLDAYRDGAVWVWDAHTREQLQTLPFLTAQGTRDNPGIITDVTIDPTHDRMYAFNSVSKQIQAWSTETWETTGTLAVPLAEYQDVLTLSPDGTSLVVAAHAHPDQAPTSASTSMLASPTYVQSSATPSDTGTGNSTSTGSGVLLFVDPLTMSIQRSVPTDKIVQDVKYSPDQRYIATIEDGTDLVLRDASTGTPIQGLPVARFQDARSMAWSPDASTIAVTETSRGTTLIDVDTMTSLAPLLSDPEGLQTADAAWSPDGTVLAVTTADTSNSANTYNGPTRLWTPSATTWEHEMCRIAGGTITPTEWDDLIGAELPYQPLCEDRQPQHPPITAYDQAATCYSPSLVAAVTTGVTGPTWTRCPTSELVVAGGYLDGDTVDQDKAAVYTVESDGTLQLTETPALATTTAVTPPADSGVDTTQLNALTAKTRGDSKVVGHDGIGGVTIGMTFEQARQVDPTLTQDVQKYPVSRCNTAITATSTMVFNPDGRLSYITPTEGFGTSTPEGLHLGDTIATAKTLYPGRYEADGIEGSHLGRIDISENSDTRSYRVTWSPQTSGSAHEDQTDDSRIVTSLVLDGGQQCFG